MDDNTYIIFIIIFLIFICIIVIFIIYNIIKKIELGSVGQSCNNNNDCMSTLICINNICQPNNDINNSTIGKPCDSINCLAGQSCLPLKVAYCNSNGYCMCGVGRTYNESCSNNIDCIYGLYCVNNSCN